MHRTAFLQDLQVRDRTLLVTALWIANLLIGCVFLWPVRYLAPWDLPNFYFAGQLIASGHADELYDRAAYIPLVRHLENENPRAAALHGIWFIRPAWEAPLFAPLALLSYANASRFVIAANLFLIGLLVWLLPKWFVSPWVTRACLMVFIPFLYSLAYGQDTLLLTLLVGSGLYLATREQDVTAGILLALASFKPQVVFLLPLAMLAARRWRMLAVFLSSVAGLLLVSLAMVGIEGLHQYLDLLHAPTSDFGVAGMGNLRAIGLNLGTSMMIGIAAVATVGFAITLYRRTFLDCACGALLMGLLVSPHTYIHDYSVLALVAVSVCPVALRYAVLVPWLYFVPENLGLIALNLASMSAIALWQKQRANGSSPS